MSSRPVARRRGGASLRAKLIADETLKTKVLMKDELEKADEILLINSVRKWITVELLA